MRARAKPVTVEIIEETQQKDGPTGLRGGDTIAKKPEVEAGGSV